MGGGSNNPTSRILAWSPIGTLGYASLHQPGEVADDHRAGRRDSLRASRVGREQVIDALKAAFVPGRLA